MKAIKFLSNDIINEIAAGEVIEKPSAVVKELIENSIDAGSDKVHISIKSGGISRILVKDNGYGINSKYIDNAVARYATSKIYKNTLDNIKTLGFRGEALYSISNASNLSIISKTENMDEAWELKIAFGKIIKKRPSKGNKGTIVEVSELFNNLPVRKKFLKSVRAESLLIKNSIKKIALGYPQITFSYSEEDKEKFLLIGRNEADKYKYRIKEVLGEDFLKSSFHIENHYEEFKLNIYASIPTFNKSNWQQSTIIINGRVVQDRLLLGVIKAAYAGLLAGNRFPLIVLYLEIPSKDLDINVHPSKTEVRILDRNKLNSVIIKLIRYKLEKLGLRYSVEAEKELLKKLKISNNLKQAKLNIDALESKEEKKVDEKIIINKEDYTGLPVAYKLGLAKAQINNMFIVSQTESSLILVDQHAAHERIVLESLKANYYDNNVTRQILLIPEIINLEQGKNNLLKYKKEIFKLGFIFDDYGENTLIVREIPAILGKINILLLFQDLSEQIIKLGNINPKDTYIEKILSTIACHNSIRAGRRLNIEEMNSVLRSMEKTPNSGQCNHGRPTFIELKLKDVEGLFGRN